MKKNRAFTLIEVMICIILTCIVVFFIYTMMLSSHRTYAKLSSISIQRNDLRYFEAIIKNSILNAEYISITTNKIIIGYYDTSGMFEEGYRLDEYSFKKNNILSNAILSQDNTKSKTLKNVNLMDYNVNKDINMYLTIYRTNQNYTSPISQLRGEEIVLKNVNKVFYRYWRYDETDTSDTPAPADKHHAHLNLSIIFSKELAGANNKLKEINCEGQEYRFSMKNMKFNSY